MSIQPEKTKMNQPTKKIHVTTLGCSKNVYDSEILMGQLSGSGASLVSTPDDADILIINTCGFIASAKQESIDAILEAEQIKKENPGKRIIVCGCLSKRYREDLKKELPVVDAFFGTEDYGNILNFLHYPGKVSPGFLYENRFQTTPAHYAFLKIGEGCNHTCSFCAIPFIRGKYRSRPVPQIVKEAEMLARRGVRELILISQDSTFYGLDTDGFQKLVYLLKELEKIEGIEWIRLHYLYPTTVQDELIKHIAASRKVVPYLDMPIQHISDRMLRIMKRGGNSERIREIFNSARKTIPGVTLRTTIIVGHPGETATEFEELTRFIREMKFDRLGVFKYSHEENTPAYKMNEFVPQEVIDERYNVLMEIQKEISTEKNNAKTGKTVQVIIDEVNRDRSYAIGRTPGDSPEIDNEVIVESIPPDLKTGSILNVLITDAAEYDLYGKIKEN